MRTARETPKHLFKAAASILDITGVTEDRLRTILLSNESPSYLTRVEAAKLARVDRRYITHMIKAGVIATARVGRRTLISETSLRNWLAEGGEKLPPYNSKCKEKDQ